MALMHDIWGYPDAPKQEMCFVVTFYSERDAEGKCPEHVFQTLRDAVRFAKDSGKPLSELLVKRRILITVQDIIPAMSFPED